jgi:hypothetical protein
MASSGVLGFISANAIGPLVRPDYKALAVAAALTGLISYLSSKAGASSLEDYVVPLIMGVFVYCHHYDRSISAAGPADKEAAAAHAPIVREPLPTPPVGSDLGALTALLQGTVPVQNAKDLGAPTWAGDVLVVLALTMDTAAQLPAFDSVASRHASSDNGLVFVAASAESSTTALNVLQSQGSVINRTTVAVLAQASALLAVRPSAGRAAQASVFVLKARGGDQGGAALAWAGHVAALERYLDAAFGRDESSSSEGEGKEK